MAAALANGSARLKVAQVRGANAVIECAARSPLRLLVPRVQGAAAWACASSFGGGMVAGDATKIEVEIDAGASCFLGSQSSTKIYRNPRRRPCSHELHARLEEAATLVLAPDPVQCFADSIYEQTQICALHPSSNLVLLDWFCGGRTARGERWNFQRYASRIEIWRDGKLLMWDPFILDATHGSLAAKFRGGRFNCMASLVLLGPKIADHAAQSLRAVNEAPVRAGSELLIGASPLAEGALLRFAGSGIEQTGAAILEHLGFVHELLGHDYLARKW